MMTYNPQPRPGFNDLGQREYALQPSPLQRQSRRVFDFGVEELWTPVLTFATPGDLNIASYSIQIGNYIRMFNYAWLSWKILILAGNFTHTTASGVLEINGVPFPSRIQQTIAATQGLVFGGLAFGGITLANYTQFTPTIIEDTSTINILASGQGQATITVNTSHLPTGGQIRLYGSLMYFI